jgi:hypothetical protein
MDLSDADLEQIPEVDRHAVDPPIQVEILGQRLASLIGG